MRARGWQPIVALLAVLVGACGSSSPEPAGAGSALSFSFESIAPTGFIDQTLTIVNRGESAIVPTLEITPLDGSGRPLPGVKVRTAYGSDRARLVVPPGEWYDILAFDGAGAVEDVRVTVAAAEEVRFPAPSAEVAVELADDTGRTVRLTNPDPEPVKVGVVYIVYDIPPPGRPQQVRRIIHVSTGTQVPASGSETVDLPAGVGRVAGAGAPASLKAYYTR